MKKYFTIFALGMMALSTAAFAGTTATNTNTVSPTLQISATIQKRRAVDTQHRHSRRDPLRRDAYGRNAGLHHELRHGGRTGHQRRKLQQVQPGDPGTTNAIYWSDYNLTPVFTSQTAISGTTITAQVTTDFAASQQHFYRARQRELQHGSGRCRQLYGGEHRHPGHHRRSRRNQRHGADPLYRRGRKA